MDDFLRMLYARYQADPNRYRQDGAQTPTGIPSIAQPKPNAFSIPSNSIAGVVTGSKTPAPQGYTGLQQGGGISNALATLASAIAPKSFGGRLGQGVLDMNQKNLNNEAMAEKLAIARQLEQDRYGGDTSTDEASSSYPLGLKPPTPEDERKTAVRETSSFLSSIDPSSPYYQGTLESLRSYANPNEAKALGIPPLTQPEPYAIGHVMKMQEGDREVFRQYLGGGKWKTISGGPKFKAAAAGGKGESSTVQIRNYNLYSSQEKAQGRTPLSFLQWSQQFGKGASKATDNPFSPEARAARRTAAGTADPLGIR